MLGAGALLLEVGILLLLLVMFGGGHGLHLDHGVKVEVLLDVLKKLLIFVERLSD